MDSTNSSQNQKEDWMILSSDNIMENIIENNNNSNNNNNSSGISMDQSSLNRSNSIIQPIPNTLISQNSQLQKQDSMGANMYLLNEDQWNIQRGVSFSNLLNRSNSQTNTSFMDQQQQTTFNTLMSGMNDFHQNQQIQMQQHQQHILQQKQQMQQMQHNPYVNNNNNNNSRISSSTNNIISPKFNSSQSSLLNTYEVSTPNVIFNNSQQMYQEDDSQGDVERSATPPTPPPQEDIQWSSQLNGSFMRSNTFLSLGPNHQNPYSVASSEPPSEYETPSKFQRTGTVNLGITEGLNRLTKDPNLQLDFLAQHTEKLNNETQMISRQSSQSDGSFTVFGHYDTGTEPIETQFYNNLLLRYNNRPELFLSSKKKQVQVLKTNNLTMANELHNVYSTMKKDIDEENSELKNLLSQRILEPMDLKKIREAIEGLKSHLRIVDVLMNELRYILNKKKPECCVGLILTQQPYSQVIFRGGKGIPDTFKVKLISGVIEPDFISSITANIDKSESASKKEKGPTEKDKEKLSGTALLENEVADLVLPGMEAEFKNLKINISTRMTPSHLKFSAYYKDKSNPNSQKIVESYPSSPLVVITNESQWATAAGKLLAADAFGDKEEISWELFANILHNHLLKVTGQENTIQRKLHSWEFDYIQKNYFNNKKTVSKSECKTFWDKFGPILQSIHFKRHISAMWFNGLIYGLITKNECNSHLMSLDVGAFLIRFSDSVPGAFAVAYVTDDEGDRVKHYLIKPEDIGANKSLPDFLRERFQFQMLYKVDPKKRSLTPVRKDESLSTYYSKRNKVGISGNPGYVSGL
ncbi:signal transducer and activator of transcription (STAT) family protein [Tieghemostelium lacteum]|uniref:Signal transducer and activator of transcription n=1 Tax=Tieghemostelium lacteum TaxID=361077 RepID=A0A152A2U6_TIELA|nr:signal transducer and activator of transcription (STAT) family protein [Tieghemostelium lacteum]|eukprot:KYR00530.1 signal transducer and activator of transcription (STAT) family protein [Tieghemostelium lacteum]